MRLNLWVLPKRHKEVPKRLRSEDPLKSILKKNDEPGVVGHSTII